MNLQFLIQIKVFLKIDLKWLSLNLLPIQSTNVIFTKIIVKSIINMQ